VAGEELTKWELPTNTELLRRVTQAARSIAVQARIKRAQLERTLSMQIVSGKELTKWSPQKNAEL
jgi:hypothetical protein